MAEDALDDKLNKYFAGKVVRKDLLHQIKKGTNVPTFVLEFLLARYCASDDPGEIEAGMAAVLATLQDNYVRPDEANAAQSKVALEGKHRFIDKVHVNYVEKERRHWAALENFGSQRVAIPERFYRDNDRLLEGGIWAEVTLVSNDIKEDDYAFSIEDLRPIQLAHFDFDTYAQGRAAFTRDEWIDTVLRSVGLEPTKLSQRLKMHFIARMAPLVEPNFNFIELGPRGTGKSYFFSEFSPYSTLISGGQATKATLFYNNARQKVGLVGFWDTVAFDEVGGIKIKDPDTVQIMKDYMANGRFSRGAEVIADASFGFVGNFDLSIDQVVRSADHDLFQPLPEEFDLAIMDRFTAYVPGWEMPKNSSDSLTQRYGLITDYLAEAFHYEFKHTNRYEEVNQRIHLGPSVEGRDEHAIKKTVCAFLKILHPGVVPTDDEFDEYVAYAVEYRRRVKEQMNKRKPDDEFAKINLSHVDHEGQEVVVYCPESKDAPATQSPSRRHLHLTSQEAEASRAPSSSADSATPAPASKAPPEPATVAASAEQATEPGEQHFVIHYGDTGYTYESIIGPYLKGCHKVVIEDPYVRQKYQIQNFLRFCEVLVRAETVHAIELTTACDAPSERADIEQQLGEIRDSLAEHDMTLVVTFNQNLHDREIRLDNGWVIKIGRGLDFYQPPAGWFDVGASDLALRKCLETKVDIYRVGSRSTDGKSFR
jgi:ATP-dependent Lon protease